MNMRPLDLVLIGGGFFVFMLPLLIGYYSFGGPDPARPALKKALIGIAAIQLVVLAYFGWLFGTSARHVNHMKWIAPLLLVDVLMWVCFGAGIAIAAFRRRSRDKP